MTDRMRVSGQGHRGAWGRAVPISLAGLVVAILGVGCGGDAAPAARAAEVRDSAGIRIVQQGERPDSLIWRTAEPVWQIGLDESVRFFDGIRAGVLLSDGRAVIADFGARELVLVGDGGVVDEVFGGEGQGPAEFGRIWSMTRMAGDTLLIEDPNNLRMSLYHPTGHIGTHPMNGRGARGLMNANGSLGGRLVMTSGGVPTDIEGTWHRGPIVTRLPSELAFDTIAWFDQADPKQRSQINPFRRWGRVAPTGERTILVARTDRPEVVLLSAAGDTAGILRWAQPEQPVDESIMQAYVDMIAELREWDAAEASAYLERVREGSSATLPHIGTLMGDAEGRIWVSEYDMEFAYRRWWVSDASGAPLGWAVLPDDLRILDIRGDLMLASREDAFGSDEAVLYRLVGR